MVSIGGGVSDLWCIARGLWTVTAKSMTVPPQHRRVYYLIILVIYTASVKSAMYSGRTSPLVVYSARRAVAKVNVGLEKGQLRTGGRTAKTGSADS